jgi:hypothetical protein
MHKSDVVLAWSLVLAWSVGLVLNMAVHHSLAGLQSRMVNPIFVPPANPPPIFGSAVLVSRTESCKLEQVVAKEQGQQRNAAAKLLVGEALVHPGSKPLVQDSLQLVFLQSRQSYPASP